MAAVAAVALLLVAGLGFATAFPLVFSVAVDHTSSRANQLSGLMATAIVGGRSSRRLGSRRICGLRLVAKGGKWYMFCNAQPMTSGAGLHVTPSGGRNFTLMRTMSIVASLLAGTFAAWLFAAPQVQGQNPSVEQQLAAQYRLTSVRRTGEVVTQGSVLVLQKNGLLLYAVSNPLPPQSSYKNGKISRPAFGGFWGDVVNVMNIPGASAAIDQRAAVAGENFWVSKIDVQKAGVVFRLYDGAGYYGELKFPFAKNAVPPADEVLRNVAEVFIVQPTDVPATVVDTSAAADTPVATPDTAAAAVPDTPATPPDQPAPPPPTVTLGLTFDQVAAILGPPDKEVDLGSKRIFSYANMKITFINGKVSNIE